ncbi:uncharacterized protein LOC125203375 [Salvia hispanica]|uniref:uncharacterized protein LOC125203375 n=1 Tax=Salvia hispanica TaxID=49212 RepID=UPI0020098875|nr:uncharacterized protein LOC125203375 [Salvia hispanica]
MAGALPSTIVISTSTDNYASRKERGLVRGGMESLLSPTVKITVEPAEADNDHIHLRFTHSNKYWQKLEKGSAIMANSNEPNEEKENPSCTLFKVRVDSDSETLYLTHAQTNMSVMFKSERGYGDVLYIEPRRSFTPSPLRFVDAGTLVKLPKHVAFKAAYNDRFLKADYHRDYTHISGHPVDYRYFHFNSNDQEEFNCGYEVFPMEDGHVMIKSDYYDKYWLQTNTWIAGAGNDVATPTNKYALFWPIKISGKENVIALRSAANNLFCKGLTLDGKYDCLNACDPSMSKYAQLEVHELVSKRSIRNVRYRMEDARIHGQEPVVVDTVSFDNPTDHEVTVTDSIEYKTENSYSFTQGLSITSGVKVSMEAELPFIGGVKTGIEVHHEITGSFNWGHTKMESITHTGTGSVPVPPKSKVIVDCVVTKGTCNIPFTYTQEDQSSTTGKIHRSDHVDGIYEGVSYYNFTFQLKETLII